MILQGAAKLSLFAKRDNLYQFVCVAIIFALSFFLFQYIWYEHDDYGYATLKYATHPEFQSQQKFISTEFSLLDLFNFLENHYMNWGGRVVPFFFLCLLLKFPPIAFSIIQTTLTAFCIWFVNKFEPIKSSLFSNTLLAILILAIPLPLLRDGVMWMTASILYYWGGLLLVIALFVLIRYPERIFSYFLIFMVSIWQENIGLALLGTVTMLALFHFKILLWRRIAIVLSSGVGAALLVLSPGNFVRMGHECCKNFYELDFVDRTILGIGRVANYHVYKFEETVPIFLFLSLGVLILLFLLYKQEGKKILLWLLMGYIGILLLLFAVAKKTFLVSAGVSGSLFIGYMLASCFIVLYDYRANKNIFYVALFSAFCFLLLSGSLSPYGGSRSLVPLYLLSLFFLFSVVSCAHVLDKLKSYILIMAFLLPAGWLSASIIYKVDGYRENYYIHQKNHQKLLDVSRKDRSTVALDQPLDEFINNPIRNTMYQMTWIKFFYGLPASTQIELSERSK